MEEKGSEEDDGDVYSCFIVKKLWQIPHGTEAGCN
jgi:hypothetical protein